VCGSLMLCQQHIHTHIHIYTHINTYTYAAQRADSRDEQDGKPYIQMAAANAPHEDPRSQGYTLVARTVFASKADMDYYDNECEAHAGIKALLRPKVEAPPLVVYMDA
jgi:hypothetical protein